MTEKRYSVWANETEAKEEGPEFATWQEAKRDIDLLRLGIIQRNWRIWRHNDDGTVTDVTDGEPATDQQATHETMSAAYEQGVEDGARQERERPRRGERVMHILATPMHEVSREPDGDNRWCFKCRKHRDFTRVVSTPTLDPDLPLEEQTGAYYGPSAHIECTHCGEIDGDCFPGTWREWE